jgi:hypothetical protein
MRYSSNKTIARQHFYISQQLQVGIKEKNHK